jgi:hypothetical protein
MLSVAVVGGGARRACPPHGASSDGVIFRAIFAPLEPLHAALAHVASCDVVAWAPLAGPDAELSAWRALTLALASKSHADGSLYQTCVFIAEHGPATIDTREPVLRRFELRWAATDLETKRLAARITSACARMSRLEHAFHELLDALARNARFHATPSPPASAPADAP